MVWEWVISLGIRGREEGDGRNRSGRVLGMLWGWLSVL